MTRTTYLSRAYSRFTALATPVIVIALLFPACKKSGGGGGGTGNGADARYPATLSFYEGNNSGYPEKSVFKYDGQHQMTFMGNDHRFTNITASGTVLTVLGPDTLFVNNLFSGNIYTGQNVERVTNNYVWKYAIGTRVQGPDNTYYFTNADASGEFIGSFNMGKSSQNFIYDKNGNLTFSNFVTNAWGSPNSTEFDPGGLEYDRIKYTGYDDKPSPYSAVPGWRYISYLWAYPWQFYLAMSKHNPTRIEEESLDRSTLKWSVYSVSDLTYTYNADGYPSQVKITTKYPSTGTPDQAFYQTYDFTYGK